MFNPLNLGVFRLLFLVGEVYFFSTSGLCVCFRLREKFFIPARYLSLTQRHSHIGYIRGYYPSHWILGIYEDTTHP